MATLDLVNMADGSAAELFTSVTVPSLLPCALTPALSDLPDTLDTSVFDQRDTRVPRGACYK